MVQPVAKRAKFQNIRWNVQMMWFLLSRSWVRSMSDMEEAEQRLNLVEILLANLGLDA